jgi:hypothetical protein
MQLFSPHQVVHGQGVGIVKFSHQFICVVDFIHYQLTALVRLLDQPLSLILTQDTVNAGPGYVYGVIMTLPAV